MSLSTWNSVLVWFRTQIFAQLCVSCWPDQLVGQNQAAASWAQKSPVWVTWVIHSLPSSIPCSLISYPATSLPTLLPHSIPCYFTADLLPHCWPAASLLTLFLHCIPCCLTPYTAAYLHTLLPPSMPSCPPLSPPSLSPLPLSLPFLPPSLSLLDNPLPSSCFAAIFPLRRSSLFSQHRSFLVCIPYFTYFWIPFPCGSCWHSIKRS